ncbi:MAG: hypothetical protein IKH76_03935 [Clostridiales bacterium]|nr:hypothetical protein [Clostridiales bacterium]
MSRKILSIFLVFAMIMPLASCTKTDSSSATDASGTSESITDEPSAPPEEDDADKTYYSSKLITIPAHTDTVYAFARGDNPCFISLASNEDENNERTVKNTLYVCNYDGEILSSCELEDGGKNYIQDCCAVSADRFVTAGYGYDYKIFGFDGKIIKASDTYTGLDDSNNSICKTDDGFMVCLGNKIVRYDVNGNKLGEIIYHEDDDVYFSFTITSVFEQKGKYYAFGLNQLENSSEPAYFTLDFETGSIEECFKPTDLPYLIDPNVSFGPDYHRSTIGRVSGGYIVEVDMEQKTANVLANEKEMLISPSTYDDDDCEIYALDQDHFYVPYTYPGKNLDVGEVALITKDDSIDLAGRTQVVIQGAGISVDSTLKDAAYLYNTSQDKYFIKLDDIAAKYDLSSPESMKRNKLNLMTRYLNGDTPDIYYGNFFDYDYMGENNMVMDIKPYLGDDPIYGRMTRDDGKIYQVYAGYSLKGYFGKSSVYKADTDITSMPALKGGQTRFGGATSADIFYQAIGSDLMSLYRGGKLTKENVLSAVRIAVEEGDDPSVEISPDDIPDPKDVKKGKLSLYNSQVGYPAIFAEHARDFGETPVYVGYPSIGGSVHMIEPICLMAVSESTEYADVCIDFIKTVMTLEVQRKICASGAIPANRDVLLEMLEVLKDPDNASKEMKNFYSMQFIKDDPEKGQSKVIPLSDKLAQQYIETVDLADRIEVYDWGLYLMARDEIKTYYSQGKSIDQIADTLYSKYLLYAQENY